MNIKIQTRNLFALEPDNYKDSTFDIIYTNSNGVVIQSPDVYVSEKDAQEAIDKLFAAWEHK